MSWHRPELRDLVADIEDVAAKAAKRLPPDALAQVLAFLTKVAHVLEQAYRDVIPVLVDIKYTKPGSLDLQALHRMRQQLELLAARSRYRDAEEICSRLSTLRSTYDENIRHLIQEDTRNEWSGLFGIIEEREGRIVSLVREQTEDLLSELSRIEEQGGSHDLYKLTSPKIKEIKAQMAELNSFTNRILGLSGKRGMLEMLKDPSEAKLVVKNLAIFSRRKYVENKYTTNGANSPIIGAGASVSGGVSNTKIRSYNLPDLAQELKALRAAMEQAKTEDPEQAIEIGQVARAEKAAASGDAHEVLSALKGVGKWTLDIAEKVGVGLVIAALKSVG